MEKKHLVLLIDGMADFPLQELAGRTPLQVAKTPALDEIAPFSEMGMVQTVPEGFAPGSDVANMSVMGYAPEVYYTGRSPFEALAMGVKLQEEEISLRCNLVTLSGEGEYSSRIMEDYSAGEISSEEAEKLINLCQEQLGDEQFSFYPGVSYRHLLVWKGGNIDIELTPPHDISDKKITDHLPRGQGADRLLNLMEKSSCFLPEHEVNEVRRQQGLGPANSIWLWGEGTRPQLDSFSEKYGLSGSVISAVDLIKGLGTAAGLQVVDVPGATGRIDTNFRGKAEAAVRCFQQGDDLVYLHVEAADEAGHQGDADTKVKAIEKVDQQVLAYILKQLNKQKEQVEFSVLVLPDHYTPVSKKTHVSDPVPFLIYRSGQQNRNAKSGSAVFTEETAQKSELFLQQGSQLMDYFVGCLL